ncbi:unnamed protein product [Paramecium primaurelia]|uniref:Uncharacterized protein n=1 Tax=Paramecium primaurelia TaxID=5886 RepID=A0A8S1QTH4_PARPR|nr:unnamed protein product [Paramecium primaurelia]
MRMMKNKLYKFGEIREQMVRNYWIKQIKNVKADPWGRGEIIYRIRETKKGRQSNIVTQNQKMHI